MKTKLPTGALLVHFLVATSAFPTFPTKVRSRLPMWNKVWQKRIFDVLVLGVEKAIWDGRAIPSTPDVADIQTALKNMMVEYNLSQVMGVIVGIYNGAGTLAMDTVTGGWFGKIASAADYQAKVKAVKGLLHNADQAADEYSLLL